MYIDIEKIKSDLIKLPNSKFVSKSILERVPYIFDENSDAYLDWRQSLSKKLKIDSHDIFITGSAALGISLNPNKNFKLFNQQSDIDISIIAPHYFDVAWHDLLYTNIKTLSSPMRTAIDDHRKRLIFWGTIATDKILPLLSFGGEWNKIITTYNKIPPFENHNINFRIYRNMTAVRNYLTISISQCKSLLMEAPKHEKLS